MTLCSEINFSHQMTFYKNLLFFFFFTYKNRLDRNQLFSYRNQLFVKHRYKSQNTGPIPGKNTL